MEEEDSGVAVEAQGFMADEAGLFHGVATVVATVEGSGVHPVALHPTKVVGCGGSFTISNEDAMTAAYFKLARGTAGVMIEAPVCTRLGLPRSDRCSCFCLWRIGLKGEKGQALHHIILLSKWNPQEIGISIQGAYVWAFPRPQDVCLCACCTLVSQFGADLEKPSGHSGSKC